MYSLKYMISCLVRFFDIVLKTDLLSKMSIFTYANEPVKLMNDFIFQNVVAREPLGLERVGNMF